MPDHPIDNAKKLQKLGERIRDGFTKENPTPDKSLETVRETIREQWEQERTTKSQRSVPRGPTKSPQRKPEGPEQER